VALLCPVFYPFPLAPRTEVCKFEREDVFAPATKNYSLYDCMAIFIERAARTRARPSPLLALGILSAPEFVHRRMAVRASWLRWPEVTEGQVAARFAVRCLGAPVWLEQVLQAETSRYADVTCLAVLHNETRVRGPVLMLAAWLAYAPRAFPSAEFIGKCDDDSYLHIPRLLQLLHTVRGPPLVYLGKLAWFHWLPGIFEHIGFGYERSLANNAGKSCRNVSSSVARQFGTCEGPFPFAAGYLIVVSTLLAATLTASPGLQADVARLARSPTMLKLNGKPQGAVMEDVWLGSIAYRYPLGPVTYVTLGEGAMDDRACHPFEPVCRRIAPLVSSLWSASWQYP